MSLLYVALGGGIGSLCRFYLSNRMNKKPIATWLINISGSILLAFLFYSYTSGHLIDEWWLFLGVGFSGAFTTFSTFGHETLDLLLKQQYKWALVYVFSSVTVSLLTVAIIFFLLS